jgi:Tol biopolymer transport system component
MITIRLSLATLAASMLLTAPAQAVLVYERPDARQVVAAQNDGSAPRVLFRGADPQVPPDGRTVTFLRASAHTSDLRLGDIDGTHSSRLLRDGHLQWPLANEAWAPNGEFVVAADAVAKAHVFDPMANQLGSIERDGWVYTSSAFSPKSTRILFDRAPVEDPGAPGILELRGRDGRNPERVGRGDYPVWGPGGIAYTARDGIRLRRGLHGRSRLILKEQFGFRWPVAWSKDGRRLLVARGVSDQARHAVIVVPEKGRIFILPQTFSEISDLSKDGKRVLGVVANDVVSIGTGGRSRTLARNAESPSWTK